MEPLDRSDFEGPMEQLGYLLGSLILAPLALLCYLVVRSTRAWVNRRSRASDPGHIRLSRTKLCRLCPGYFGDPRDPVAWLDRHLGLRATHLFLIADHLRHGDSRAAMVVSVAPLRVAAYTDELDCIALLEFPAEIAQEYGLRVRDRLLTVNRYEVGGGSAADLRNGPLSYHRYSNFQPLIADFLTEETARLCQRKSRIGEDEWTRCWVLAQRYLEEGRCGARVGRPSRCAVPAAAEPVASYDR